MTRDRSLVLVLIGLVTLAVATAAALWSSEGPSMANLRGERWDAWVALTRSERLELAHLYQKVQDSDDPLRVLNRVRRFAELSPEGQERRRTTQAALNKVLTRLTPPQRRALLILPPEGRAAQLLRIMQTRFPDELQPLLPNPLGSN